jgi:hypothetical protein
VTNIHVNCPGAEPWCVFGSGSRDLRRDHYPRILAALEKYAAPSGGVFIHGDGEGRNGSVGFDKLAAHAAEKLGFRCYGFPADWERLKKPAGPIRNRLCAEVLFAFKGAGYRIAFIAFPTGSTGTGRTIDLVTKMVAQRGVAVQVEQFPVTL